MSDEDPNAQADPLRSDEETDRLALAAAEAIKRLIAERAALRSLVTTQERELVRLRDHLNLIRNSYRRLANELVTQLQLIDNLDGEVAEKPAAELHWRTANARGLSPAISIILRDLRRVQGYHKKPDRKLFRPGFSQLGG